MIQLVETQVSGCGEVSKESSSLSIPFNSEPHPEFALSIVDGEKKRCSKCGEEKDVSEFCKKRSVKSGISSKCKRCDCEEHKEYRKINCEKIRTTRREYYLKNKEKISKASRLFGKNNSEKIKIAKKEYYQKTKDSRREKARIKYQKNKERAYLYSVGRRYGVSKEDIEKMLVKQAGRCVICNNLFDNSRNTRSNVDHNHVTMAFRGLLCRRCNNGLGNFSDSPERLRAAADYLQRTDGL